MAHDVFISYSSHDKPVADAVCGSLEARGVRCWIAPRDVTPGMSSERAVAAAIEASKVMVRVQSSDDAGQATDEVERAVSAGIPVLPFGLDDGQTAPATAHVEGLAESVALLLRSAVVTERQMSQTLPAPPPGDASALSVDCSACGRQNVPEARFCATCGRSLAPVAASSPAPAHGGSSGAAAPAGAHVASWPSPAPASRPAADVADLEAPPRTLEANRLACPACGHDNGASALFCEDCGTNLRAPAGLRDKNGRSIGLAGRAPASFTRRAAAYLVDTLIYVVLWFIVLMGIVGFLGEEGTATDASGLSAIFIVYFLYHWAGALRGRTLGMDILGLRIVDEAGAAPLSGGRALLRAFMITLGTTFLGLGLLNALWDDRNQTWHDQAAKSIVVSTR